MVERNKNFLYFVYIEFNYADLTSTIPQREVKDHFVSLGVTCGQHIEFPQPLTIFCTHIPTMLDWHRCHILAENVFPAGNN